ncbi:SDR family oxidoreductase [Arthrobacter sp. zg-Y916]|uniref:NAD(P)H-binding protein n=1 Tax=Arthrobacter sp. zg-Y916 TaxID=2894190 RepID=UPI001E37E213|nr:NAD(P)H-binding protein [Arthrobacter sp. zg-Y916]MCC9193974.1 SDR family oxidoreductase [Arthrobacter sp. zg-Y916]
MRIVIAGAHGQIARETGRLLGAAGNDVARLIRDPDQSGDLERDLVAPVVLDLENSTLEDLTLVLSGADVAVFAAGAGPGSSIERKDAVDRAGAVLLAEAAEQAGVQRLIQISSAGTETVREGRPEGTSDAMYAYLTAKLAAEEDLRSRESLDWTIVKPGTLTNGDPVGLVELGRDVAPNTIPRQDVAAVLAELVTSGRGGGQVLGLVTGTETIPEAVAALPVAL